MLGLAAKISFENTIRIILTLKHPPQWSEPQKLDNFRMFTSLQEGIFAMRFLWLCCGFAVIFWF